MNRCFVIQPFDGGVFDARYEDLIVPAIEGAGLAAYRVDRDPTVSIPIQEIENGIRDAVVCLADITLDNPNVWFELGYAISAQKEVVLVCSTERGVKFPFDVQHRSIITYKTGAPRDFDKLKTSITDRLAAIMMKEETLQNIVGRNNVRTIEKLDLSEVVVLAAICENVDSTEDHASTWQLRQDMERAGFTSIATTLALKSLVRRHMIDANKHYDGNNEYVGYNLTEAGWDWVLENKDKFTLRKPPKPGSNPGNRYEDLDDDIPF